jgi:hypothetical protein
MSPAGHGDNNATFLAEFRALRDRAGLDHAELAARAHYPSDLLKEAEAGPGLPGLPVLAAYVRACDADVTEWEERWRRLAAAEPVGEPGGEPVGEPGLAAAQEEGGLPVRPAGASPAAQAGARAGVTVASADVHDPDRIRAALRAHHAREDKTPGRSGNGNGGATMLANGHHHRPPAVAHASATARYAAPDSAGLPASAGLYQPELAPAESAAPHAESAAISGPGTADHFPVPRMADHFSVPPASGLTAADNAPPAGNSSPVDSASPAGNASPAGHLSPDSHHAPNASPTAADVTAAHGPRSHGSGQLKLVGLVLIVLIGCIVLLTVI